MSVEGMKRLLANTLWYLRTPQYRSLSARTWLAFGQRHPCRYLSQLTRQCHLPMKPGKPIPGLDIYKDKEAPVALERDQYPEWVSSLAKPMITLAKLRKMPIEEATDKDKRRYLKLTRRRQIKAKNDELRKK